MKFACKSLMLPTVLTFMAMTSLPAIAAAPGYCTDGIAKIKGDEWFGDAKTYYNTAKDKGIPTTPASNAGGGEKPGSIVVFGPTSNNSHGHVAVATGNGTFIHMNGAPCGGLYGDAQCRNTFGKFSEVTWDQIKSSGPVIGYVHYKLDKICPPSNSAWYGSHPSCP